MFDLCKKYKNTWKLRRIKDTMDIVSKLVSLGILLQLIGSIGKWIL